MAEPEDGQQETAALADTAPAEGSGPAAGEVLPPATEEEDLDPRLAGIVIMQTFAEAFAPGFTKYAEAQVRQAEAMERATTVEAGLERERIALSARLDELRIGIDVQRVEAERQVAFRRHRSFELVAVLVTVVVVSVIAAGALVGDLGAAGPLLTQIGALLAAAAGFSALAFSKRDGKTDDGDAKPPTGE